MQFIRFLTFFLIFFANSFGFAEESIKLKILLWYKDINKEIIVNCQKTDRCSYRIDDNAYLTIRFGTDIYFEFYDGVNFCCNFESGKRYFRINNKKLVERIPIYYRRNEDFMPGIREFFGYIYINSVTEKN